MHTRGNQLSGQGRLEEEEWEGVRMRGGGLLSGAGRAQITNNLRKTINRSFCVCGSVRAAAAAFSVSESDENGCDKRGGHHSLTCHSRVTHHHHIIIIIQWGVVGGSLWGEGIILNTGIRVVVLIIFL